MTVNELVEKLELEVFSGKNGLEDETSGGYTSDLMSDVVGHSEKGNVWITLPADKNVMAIASLRELAAVILVKGFSPDKDTLEKSNEENIPILGTSLETFEITGRVFEALKYEIPW